MVECRTRPKKDGGKYTICYDEKSKAKPLAKAKPKPKLKVVEDVKPKAKPVAKAKPKPKLKVVEVVKPKVSEKAKAIIAAGKITNRLDDLPQELQDKIMKYKDEADKADEGKFKVGEWEYSKKIFGNVYYDNIKIIAVRPKTLTFQVWVKKDGRGGGGYWDKKMTRKIYNWDGWDAINMGDKHYSNILHTYEIID